MKAPVVHKFMRKAFMPFLYEHGLERPMSPTTGIACTNRSGFHIRLGYELQGGFYDWTGNEICLVGTVSQRGSVKRWLQANVVQPDDLLPTQLRSGLREIALAKLSQIVADARCADRRRSDTLDLFRRAEQDHLFVPAYRYRDEADLLAWCAIVRPHIPECVSAMKVVADDLRGDA